MPKINGLKDLSDRIRSINTCNIINLKLKKHQNDILLINYIKFRIDETEII